MKLDRSEKNLRKIMKGGFAGEGGQLFSFVDSGMTVAVRPVCGSDSKFCEVSVAFCNFDADEFNRKRGELEALTKWENCEFVKVPMFNNTVSDIADMFNEMFGTF